MMTDFLPYGRQLIEDDDIAAVTGAMRSDFLTSGPRVAAFEKTLAARVGADRAVAVSNGTAALHLAALALELKPGDQVIVPAITFLATANAARLAGAEVVFSDVDPETGLMEISHLEQAIANADRATLRAVFPVHLAGQAAPPEETRAVAQAHGLAIIEDACHALGTKFGAKNGDENQAGGCAHSDMTVFSFHPVKTIAMGEGGAVTTNNHDMAARVALLRNHGMTRDAENFRHTDMATATSGAPNPWYYEMAEIGLNYRASDIHCALGLSQLAKLDRMVSARRALVKCYDTQLASLAPAIRPLGRAPACTPAWHLYVVLIDFQAIGKDRAAVINELKEKGIGTQVHYIPVPNQPYYLERYGEGNFPGAQGYYERALSLPLFPAMTEADVQRVVDTLAKITSL